MAFRHEWKHEISLMDLYLLRSRLKAVMSPDPHAVNGVYFVRSLYFDTPSNRALREKIDGVNRREKFRIRYYNQNFSQIFLEKKSKINGLCRKETIPISQAEAAAAAARQWKELAGGSSPLLRELGEKILQQGLEPKGIVDYTREPYLFSPGNVRVTLDYHIRTSLNCLEFLHPDCPTIPVPHSPLLLEVKWDTFLPDLIRDLVQLENRSAGAFSKYAACRAYD